MKNTKKIEIRENSTIKNALKVISNGSFQVALVVNSKGKLLGTLTDGDIRNGLLKGKKFKRYGQIYFLQEANSCQRTLYKRKIVENCISKQNSPNSCSR